MEGRVIEYKRELTKDVDGLEREVVSFLNTFGGELIFGLANDGNTSMEFLIQMMFRSVSHNACLKMCIHHVLVSSISKLKQRMEANIL